MELSRIQNEVYRSDESLLITAGAGSGKTRVLVEKYVNVFEEYYEANQPLRIDQVVAITFTEKAAREMKERVMERLSDALSQGKKEPYLRIKREMPFARISTIHAFCSRILRESALFSGLDPDFKITSGISAIRRIYKLVDSYMMENISEIEKFFEIDSTITFQKLRKWMREAIEKRWNEDFVPDGIENDTVAKLYRHHANALIKSYSKISKNESVIDFEDLLLFTRELLEKNDEIRKRYADYFVHIFIDEFQDTNELQSQIIDLLRTKSNKIWYIGDPKQSIYAFRGANVDVFLKVERESDSYDVVVKELQENYRSAPNLVKFYNAFFTKAFSDGPISYSKQIKTSNSDGKKRVWLLENGVVGKAQKARPAEAESIARIVSELHASGRSFSDMAILLKVMTNVKFIERAFVKYNIPHHVIGGKNFFDRSEVLAIENLISVIVDPYNDRAMIGLLLSPFFDLTLDEVLYLKKDKSRIYDAMKQSGKYSEIVDLVNTLIQLKNTIDVSKMIEIAIRKTDYLAKLSQFKDGDKRVANVMKFLNSIGSFDIPLWDVDSVRRVVEMSHEESEEEASALSEGEDVVKILTVHKAKGLEFPIVILAQMEAGKGAKNEADFQESKRLLYVAMTRAKDLIILSKENLKRPSKNPWPTLLKEYGFIDENDLWQIPEDMKDLVELKRGYELPEPEVKIEMKKFDFIENYFETPQISPERKIYTVTDLYLKEKSDLDFGIARQGIVVHQILEKLGELRLSQVLESDFMTMYPQDLVEEVKGTLRLLENHPLISRIERAQSVKSEFSIQLKIPELGMQIVGKLDKIIKNKDGWEIIDFKYSHHADEKSLSDYEFQMRVYMLAFEELTGEQARGTIFFLKNGNERNVDFKSPRNEFLAEITRRMELLKSRR